MIKQERPGRVEDAVAFPAFERAMHRGIITKGVGQLVPLTAGACPVQNAVEALALVGAGTACLAGRVSFLEDRKDNLFPEIVGHLPNRCQCLGVGTGRR